MHAAARANDNRSNGIPGADRPPLSREADRLWTPRPHVKDCAMPRLVSRLLPVLLAFLLAACGRSVPRPVASPPTPPRLRELDFAPFADALDRIGPRRLRQIDRLVASATVPAAQEALAKGELSSEELALSFLDRIRRHDGHLRSYLELNPHALDEAREADRLRAAGEGKGPLREPVPTSRANQPSERRKWQLSW